VIIIRAKVSVYFASLVAIALVLDTTGLVLYAILAIIFHEFGHIIMLWICKIPVSEIDFKPFGICIVLSNNNSISYRKEIMIAVGGPLMNLLLASASLTLSSFGIFQHELIVFAIFSVAAAIFNLLPIGPLDGGRILTAIFCIKYDAIKADRIIKGISIILLSPLLVLGIYVLLWSKHNVTMLIAAIYLLITVLFKDKMFKVAKH
jgi:stage IV sporulation protein FB